MDISIESKWIKSVIFKISNNIMSIFFVGSNLYEKAYFKNFFSSFRQQIQVAMPTLLFFMGQPPFAKKNITKIDNVIGNKKN